MKKHKMLLELVAQKETEHGAIGIMESIEIMKKIGDIAKKYKFDCYAKGYPKEKLDYIPTNKTIKIKTIEDIAELSEQQFEFFIDDLRNFCNISRQIKSLEKLGLETGKKEKGMTWLDTGLNESKINIEIESSNKI